MAFSYITAIILINTFFFQGGANGEWLSEEKNLHNDVMKGYNRYIRPVKDGNKTIHVSFEMSLLHIDDLDEKSQTLGVHTWIRLSWKDEQISWNPSKYGNVQTMRIPIDQLWKPDFELYNSVSLSMWQTSSTILALVYSDGSVLWIPPVQMNVRCSMDMTRFPFDEHTCTLKFGMWTYNSNEVNITWYGKEGKLDLEDYAVHQEWELKKWNGVREDKVYECCPGESYPSITYSVTLARRSSLHTHLYIVPSIVFMFLMPAMFVLPPDSGEKIMLGVGIIVSQTLLLVSIESVVPAAHPTVPLVGQYYLANIVLTALSLFFCSFVIGAWSKSNRNSMVPGLLRTVFLGILGRLLCVRRDTFMPLEANDPVDSPRRLDIMTDNRSGGGGSGEAGDSHPGFGDDDKQRMMATYARLTTVSEWRQLAIVLDRLLFVLFVIVAVMVFFVMGTK